MPNTHKHRKYNTHSKDAKHPKTLVVIVHAHWCGACKQTMPIWEEFKTLSNGKHSHQLEIIDIEEKEKGKKIPMLEKKHLKNRQKVEISGYPTIFKIEGGKIEYYNGKRTPQDFLDWALKEHSRSFGGIEHTKTDETLILGGMNKTKKNRKSRKRGCSSCDKSRTRRWNWKKTLNIFWV